MVYGDYMQMSNTGTFMLRFVVIRLRRELAQGTESPAEVLESRSELRRCVGGTNLRGIGVTPSIELIPYRFVMSYFTRSSFTMSLLAIKSILYFRIVKHFPQISFRYHRFLKLSMEGFRSSLKELEYL